MEGALYFVIQKTMETIFTITSGHQTPYLIILYVYNIIHETRDKKQVYQAMHLEVCHRRAKLSDLPSVRLAWVCTPMQLFCWTVVLLHYLCGLEPDRKAMDD